MRVLLTACVGLAALVMAGCASPGSSVTPTRANPTGTVETFKVALSRDDFGTMWDVLSPNFKKRLSQRAGRNIDQADFEMAWKSMRSDARVQLAENLLESARVTDVQMRGQDSANVTVVAGPGGPLGKTINGGMVRLITWELRVAGDPQPFTGIVGSETIGIERGGDGGYVVWTRASAAEQKLRDAYAPSEVESYNAAARWYVDSLGDLEAQFFGSASDAKRED